MSLQTTHYSLIDAVRELRRPEDCEKLTAIYYSACRGYCLKRGVQPADADDIVQKCWMSMFQNGLDKYDRSKGRFRNWLFTCLGRLLSQFFSRRKAGERGSGLTDVKLQLDETADRYSDFDALCAFNAFEWALREVKAEFSERDWSIFVRMEYDKESAESVAADADPDKALDPHTVREIRRKVRDRLLEVYLSVD